MAFEILENQSEDQDYFERTVLWDSKPVLRAIIDAHLPEPECTLTWKLSEGADFRRLIANCLLNDGLIPAYNVEYEDSIKLEFWANDKYYSLESDSFNINSIIINDIYYDDRLKDFDLLQFVSERIVVEILLNGTLEKPERISLLFQEIRANEICQLFNAFHKDEPFKNNPGIIEKILNSQFLSPIPRAERVEYGKMEKSARRTSMHRS
jgi:hypothetical protein